jgi:hypothetical protein
MLTTHVFGFATGAAPDQVWSALTDAGPGDAGREAEDTWLPVLADLHAELAGDHDLTER